MVDIMAALVGTEDITEAPVAPDLAAAIIAPPMGGGMHHHHHHPMGGGMWHRPPRNRGCCGCLFPVIGVIGALIAAFALIL